jgi:stage V sporulation protein R
MWERIIAEQGIERAFQIRAEDDDFSFVRNYLSEDVAKELELFRYQSGTDGTVKIMSGDIDALRDAIVSPKYNFGAPAIMVSHVQVDGTLELTHGHESDGRGLDLERADHVLTYIRRVWRRPVKLTTADTDGRERVLTCD